LLGESTFTCIPVPTPPPFTVGPVNAYLHGRTLVDPGPHDETSWSALVDGLAEAGLDPEDIERVIVTHPHIDHFGSVGRFASLGASVVASDAAAQIVPDFEERWAYERSYFEDFLVRHVWSPDIAATKIEEAESNEYLSFVSESDIDRSVGDGDSISLDDVTLSVRSVAGHGPGELAFSYERDGRRRAIVGDNVLADITPNPFLQPPPESGGDRPRTLPEYNDSLAALADACFDQLLPGHRGSVERPAARIDEILVEHDERTERVADMLDKPTTPVEVMRALFGDLPATEQYMGMSEAVGHLDVLEARGEIASREQGGVAGWEGSA
jgi:glyoxylase-like metal-dependent hydrolase (beta-lactamase superfamily II)